MTRWHYVVLLLFCIQLIYHSCLASHLEEGKDERNEDHEEGNVDEQEGGDSSRPHIIYIFVDDAGYDDFGFQSSDLSWTQPNIIKAARDEGIILASYYSEPHCTPSRSAFMTGKYAVNVGMTISDVMCYSPYGLPTDVNTVADRMKELGYQTHQIGKWDIGHFKDQYLPNARGFDTFEGWMGPSLGSYTRRQMYPTFSYPLKKTNLETWDWLRGNQSGWWPGEARDYNATYSTDLITDLALNRIAEASNGTEPLFLYLNYQATHSDMEAGIEDFEDIPEVANFSAPIRRVAAAVWLGLDAAFQTLQVALEESGMANNTIVIMVSDNGGCPGVGGFTQPLRGCKDTLFEGGVHVPGFIWSRMLPKEVQGTVYDHLMHVSDWLPTIYAMAGGDGSALENDTLDGVNQWPALLGMQDSQPRTEALMHINAWETEWNSTSGTYDVLPAQQPVMAYRLGDYKLIMNHECDGYYGMSDDGESVTCHNELTAQVCSDGKSAATCQSSVGGSLCGSWPRPGHHYLFNIREDPKENYNLFGRDNEMKRVARKISNKMWKILLKAPQPQWAWPTEDEQMEISNQFRLAGGYVVPWDN